MNMLLARLLIPALFLLWGCGTSQEDIRTLLKTDADDFKSYWYQGKAEINHYRLKQARYGEIHEGDAVLIFVTEDFLRGPQVKREFGDDPSDSVLKLNAARKFNTGLYPYSLMTSVFTKVHFENPETPKVTFSGQEWCGQVFMQMNLKDDAYQTAVRSYFQREGDRDFAVPKALLEDELWTRIRIAPETLPLGEVMLVPSLSSIRLDHRETTSHQAETTLRVKVDRTFSKKALYVYRVAYKDLERELVIHFEKEAPYRILGWRETGKSGFGDKAKKLTTTAVRTHELITDYWSKNKKNDRKLRRKLGLKP